MMAASIEAAKSPLEGAPSFDQFLQDSMFPGLKQQQESCSDVSHSILSLASSKVINQRAFANNIGIPIGAIVNCLPENLPGVPRLAKPPVCCKKCGASINPFCRVEVQVRRWHCSFCGSVNVLDGEFGHPDLQVAPELTNEAVDYITVTTDTLPIVGLPQLSTLVIVVDATMDEQTMVPVRQALKLMLQNLHQNTEVCLISFDGCVSIYDLKKGNTIVDAHVIPGHTIELPTGSRKVFAQHIAAPCRISSCSMSAQLAVDSICAHKTHLSQKERPRCLGTALHEALRVLQEHRKSSTSGSVDFSRVPKRERILLLAGGTPTYGPGSKMQESINKTPEQVADNSHEGLGLFMRLASVAQGMGVPVDTFGLGPSSSGVAILEPMGRSTGGSTTVHYNVNATMLAASMQAALFGTFGVNGLLDVRLSHGLQLASVIGNVFERLGSGESGVRKLSSNACSIRNLETGKGLGLWLEATKDLDQQHLYIQVLLSWKSLDGNFVERVVTKKLTPTGNLADFMKGINPSAASVLLAKKIVLDTAQALASRKGAAASDIRLGLSAKLAYLAEKFGKVLESKTGLLGFGAQKKWSCPQELSAFVHALYHLQRSPLMVTHPSRSGDQSFLHSVFLSGSLASSGPMLTPRMYQLHPTKLTFQEVPPLDIALRHDTAALLDHGTHIFVWLGDSISRDSNAGDENDSGALHPSKSTSCRSLIHSCERYAEILSRGRVPIPELRIVGVGYDSADWILSRVVPARSDSHPDQKNQFPSNIPFDQQTTDRVCHTFPTPTEQSLYEWCRSSCVEPPRQDVASTGSMSGL